MWCGPTSAIAIHEHFDRIFRRRVVATGDVYFRSRPSVVDKVYRDLLKKRHAHVPDDVEFSPFGRSIFRAGLTGQQAVQLIESEEAFTDADGSLPQLLIIDRQHQDCTQALHCHRMHVFVPKPERVLRATCE